MHSLNLGYCLWVIGGALFLAEQEFHLWGDATVDRNQRLYDAYVDFRKWARDRKIQYPGDYNWSCWLNWQTISDHAHALMSLQWGILSRSSARAVSLGNLNMLSFGQKPTMSLAATSAPPASLILQWTCAEARVLVAWLADKLSERLGEEAGNPNRHPYLQDVASCVWLDYEFECALENALEKKCQFKFLMWWSCAAPSFAPKVAPWPLVQCHWTGIAVPGWWNNCSSPPVLRLSFSN